jgi:hypothetical protein
LHFFVVERNADKSKEPGNFFEHARVSFGYVSNGDISNVAKLTHSQKRSACDLHFFVVERNADKSKEPGNFFGARESLFWLCSQMETFEM